MLVPLRDALKDQDCQVRKVAVEALGDLQAPDPAILTVLPNAIGDQARSVRWAAVEVLRDLLEPWEISRSQIQLL